MITTYSAHSHWRSVDKGIHTPMKQITSLGDERRLIFQNYCNGVPKEDIALAFYRSAEEVTKDILFVAKKIREYRHRRCVEPNPEQGLLPPVPCDTEHEIRSNRHQLLWTLKYLGPEYLTSDLLLPTLVTQKIEADRPEQFMEAARAIRAGARMAA